MIEKGTRPVLTELPASFTFGTLDRLNGFAQYVVNSERLLGFLGLWNSAAASQETKQFVRIGIDSVLHDIFSRSPN